MLEVRSGVAMPHALVASLSLGSEQAFCSFQMLMLLPSGVCLRCPLAFQLREALLEIRFLDRAQLQVHQRRQPGSNPGVQLARVDISDQPRYRISHSGRAVQIRQRIGLNRDTTVLPSAEAGPTPPPCWGWRGKNKDHLRWPPPGRASLPWSDPCNDSPLVCCPFLLPSSRLLIACALLDRLPPAQTKAGASRLRF